MNEFVYKGINYLPSD